MDELFVSSNNTHSYSNRPADSKRLLAKAQSTRKSVVTHFNKHWTAGKVIRHFCATEPLKPSLLILWMLYGIQRKSTKLFPSKRTIASGIIGNMSYCTKRGIIGNLGDTRVSCYNSWLTCYPQWGWCPRQARFSRTQPVSVKNTRTAIRVHFVWN